MAKGDKKIAKGAVKGQKKVAKAAKGAKGKK